MLGPAQTCSDVLKGDKTRVLGGETHMQSLVVLATKNSKLWCLGGLLILGSGLLGDRSWAARE